MRLGSARELRVQVTPQFLRPPPDLTVSEWADRYRRLSSEASAEPGAWRTDRAPYQRGIMDALSDPEVYEIWCKKSAQVGWTEILNNVVGYYAAVDPSPILMIQPTLEMGEAWSKDRFAPMLRDTPALGEIFSEAKSRDNSNTLLHKRFPGGHITVAGANSPAGLASRPIRVVVFDEVDRFPVSAGTEGDPIALGKKRQLTFWNRKTLGGSTPTVKGASRIDAAYEGSDRRRYFVPCPHCAAKQVLEWKNLHWDADDPATAHYACPHCGGIAVEADRPAMLAAGEWRATAPFRGVAGFHISELYSPWVRWSEMVASFLEAKRFPETLRTWVNTSLGETWDEHRDAVDPDAVRARAEDYALAFAPAGALFLTAGVDVQGDRLEAYTWGYGADEEAWVVDFRAFYGDPAQKLVWDQLLEHLARPVRHELGGAAYIRMAAIDSGGHHTQEVYSFARNHGLRHLDGGVVQEIRAVKGASVRGKPIVGRPTAQDINLRGERIARGVKLWPVGSYAAKERLYARLGIETPGPGFIHTTRALPEEFFPQLVAERLVTKYVRGFATLEWTKPHARRNEALDCAVYAYAAAAMLGIQRLLPRDWSRLRERIVATAVPAAVAGDGPEPAETEPTPLSPSARASVNPGARWAASPPASAAGGNFVTGWRR